MPAFSIFSDLVQALETQGFRFIRVVGEAEGKVVIHMASHHGLLGGIPEIIITADRNEVILRKKRLFSSKELYRRVVLTAEALEATITDVICLLDEWSPPAVKK